MHRNGPMAHPLAVFIAVLLIVGLVPGNLGATSVSHSASIVAAGGTFEPPLISHQSATVLGAQPATDTVVWPAIGTPDDHRLRSSHAMRVTGALATWAASRQSANSGRNDPQFKGTLPSIVSLSLGRDGGCLAWAERILPPARSAGSDQSIPRPPPPPGI
jgi:hypothetical protein